MPGCFEELMLAYKLVENVSACIQGKKIHCMARTLSPNFCRKSNSAIFNAVVHTQDFHPCFQIESAILK